VEPDQLLSARRRAADIAEAVLTGRLSPVLAAIDLNRLRPMVDVPDDDADFETFTVIDSECDALPFGRVRQHWAPKALARKQSELEHAERWAMETGEEAFRNIVKRFAATA